jgi:Apoptosis regulator proteins, Bcl-2 family
MSSELERLHPRTFCNVSIPLPEAAPVIVESIGRTLFKHNDITWGKIISFMTISSAIAVECAKSGQSEVIQSVVDSTFSVMNEEAGPWIETEGGWCALTEHIRPIGSEHITFLGCLTLMVGFLVTIHVTWTSLKFLGKQVLNIL